MASAVAARTRPHFFERSSATAAAAPQEASSAAAMARALCMPRLLGSGLPAGAARPGGFGLEKPWQPPRSPEAAVDWASMEPMRVAVAPMEARLEPMRVELPGTAAAPSQSTPAAGPPGRFCVPRPHAAAPSPPRGASGGPRLAAPGERPAAAGPLREAAAWGPCAAPPPGLDLAAPGLGAAPPAGTRASEPPPPAGARADGAPGGAGASGARQRRRGAAREGRFTASFVFTGFDCDQHADFELVPRLIGRGGCNMRAIAQACDGKVRIRGRGSGHCEEEDGGSQAQEADVPLQVALSCRSHAALQLGLRMLLELLASMSSHFARYCRTRGIAEPEQLYEVM